MDLNVGELRLSEHGFVRDEDLGGEVLVVTVEPMVMGLDEPAPHAGVWRLQGGDGSAVEVRTLAGGLAELRVYDPDGREVARRTVPWSDLGLGD